MANKHTAIFFMVFLLIIFGIFLLGMCTPNTGFAAQTISSEGTGEDAIEQVRQNFESLATIYGGKIRDYALSIFKIFAFIGIFLFGIKAAFSRSEISDVIKEFIIMMIWVSFCFTAIFYSNQWMSWLMDTQLKIASNVTGLPTDSLSMNLHFLALGFDVITQITKSVHWYNPSSAIYALIYFIIAGVSLCCIALICARMLIIVCESYIAMCISVFIMAFGGAEILKEYTTNVMRYAVSLAFKLFAMEIIMAVAYDFLQNVSRMTVFKLSFHTLFIFLVCSLVLLVLCQQIPDVVAGIVNGSHVGGGAGMAAAAGALITAAKIIGKPAAQGTVNTAVGVGHAGGAVARAVKIASLNGWGNQADKVARGGVGGFVGRVQATGTELGKMYQEARQDEKRSGMNPSAMGELRRMNASSRDGLAAMRAAKAIEEGKTPDLNLYSRGRGGNEIANELLRNQRNQGMSGSAGRDGKDGERGDKGDPGRPGREGERDSETGRTQEEVKRQRKGSRP